MLDDAAAPLPQRLRLLALVMLVGLLWGLSPALAKFAVDTGAHPLGLMLWLLGGGGVLLLAATLARGRRVPCDRPHLRLYTIAGIAGTIPGLVIFTATRHITIGVISILVAAVPLMTYLGGLLLRIEHLSLVRFSGIVLGLAAVLLLVLPGGDLGAANSAAWIIIGLLIPAGYTIENLYIALRRPPLTDTITLACGLMMASAVLLAPLVWLADAFVPLSLNPGTVEYAILGMVLIGVFCYVVFIDLVRAAGPVFAGLVGYSAMLFGVCWGIQLFDEQHTAWVWAAVVLMLTGMALIREHRAAPHATQPPARH